MKGDRLYDTIEFILNEATEEELEVVRSALKRRVEGKPAHGAMGIDPGRMARQTASQIREQMGLSVDQIRSMVSGFAVDIIRKNAPELTEEQIRELLKSWIPESGTAGGQSGSRAAESNHGTASGSSPNREGAASGHDRSAAAKRGGSQGKGRSKLSPDVILTMVTQFLAYSDETMSVSEQMRLNQEIPDWQRRYWEQFSPRTRELLSLNLRGQIDRKTCLERVCADLGIDADLSE